MVDVALAIPFRDGRILVARRAAGSHLAGDWEFPGGKITDDELPQAAARRELSEETGLVAQALEPLGLYIHEYPERSVKLHVFLARDPAGSVRIDAGREHAWLTPDEVRALEMPAANAAIVRALCRRIGP